jgi:hypothetical protein
MNHSEAERRYVQLMQEHGATMAASAGRMKTPAGLGRLAVAVLTYARLVADRLPGCAEKNYARVLAAWTEPAVRRRYVEFTRPGLPDGPR